MTTVEIKLNRFDRVYRPGDTVSGYVLLKSATPFTHSGVTIELEGTIGLQLSAKSVGLFEAFYSSMKPVPIIQKNETLNTGAKCPNGETRYEFAIDLTTDGKLNETYHGVFINIQYTLAAGVKMGMMTADVKKSIEFIVEIPEPVANITIKPAKLNITPASVERMHEGISIPDFRVCGKIDNLNCDLRKPMTGEIIVDKCEAGLSSIDLQLIRIETCGCAEGIAREATEIQSIQLASGDVCQGEQWKLPIHMFFPRLFTCPTMSSRGNFKIEFEVNVVVKLADGHVIAENFPLNLCRPDSSQ